jgi:hypothetical protein
MRLETFLLEDRNDRPAQLLHDRFQKRPFGLPGIDHHQVEEKGAVAGPQPAQQPQGRGAFLFARTHRLEIQDHAQLRTASLGIDLLVIILRPVDLPPAGVLAGNLAPQAPLATAVVAAKLFVGVQAHAQQTVDFVGFKGLASFEFAVDIARRPAPLFGSRRSLT